MTTWCAWVRGLLLALVCAGAAWAQTAPPVPLERFFAPAAMQGVTLSPSGRWLAALASLPGRRVGFQMVDLEGKEAPRFIEASDTDDVAWFQWFTEDWLLFSLRDTTRGRYIHRGPGLMVMRRDGSDSRQLVARGYSNTPRKGELAAGHYLESLGKPGSMELLVGWGHGDRQGEYTYTSLKALNVVTGAWRRVYEDAPRAREWWFDGQGRPRLISRLEDQQLIYLWADARGDDTGSKAEDWREIARMPMLDPTWQPAYIEGDDKLFVTTYDAQGYTELRRFDFASGKPATIAVLNTPGFSSGVVLRREERGGPLIGVDLSLDAATTEWFTPEMRTLQDRVDARLPGRVNLLRCRPCDKPGVVLVTSYADNDPGQYLLYRVKEDKWQLLGAARPDIDPQRMARMAFHRIQARDGRDLPVWVTRMPQAAGAPPPPAVVLVHGGPHMRGAHWGWDPEAQFLASRGYVVIEPEFRGSEGYGELHHRAGWKQWGGAMVDDITDALRHAIAQGWVDGRRVCVMGSSYGGYASLMSLVKEPDQYRCGIAHAAMSDLRHDFEFHWSDASRDVRKIYLPLVMGDPKKDAAMFIATSPLEQVRRIKAPLLLVHGDDDYRVPLENGERMRDALKKHDKDVEWVLYVDEGHGFARQENLLDYWRRVEAFLGKHLR